MGLKQTVQDENGFGGDTSVLLILRREKGETFEGDTSGQGITCGASFPLPSSHVNTNRATVNSALLCWNVEMQDRTRKITQNNHSFFP
jgi:hypothetical protein